MKTLVPDSFEMLSGFRLHESGSTTLVSGISLLFQGYLQY